MKKAYYQVKVCRQLFHCETLLAAEGPEFVGEYYYDYWK